jgi:hypothetical protein
MDMLNVRDANMVAMSVSPFPPAPYSLHRRPSKVPVFGRRRLPIVVTPIDVGDGRTDEFIDIHVIEAINVDGVRLAAQFWCVYPAERVYSAMLAKQVVDSLGAELIIGEFGLARKQPKFDRYDEGEPFPHLGANRTVTFESTCAQIKVRFIADRATVTASNVCFFMGDSPSG